MASPGRPGDTRDKPEATGTSAKQLAAGATGKAQEAASGAAQKAQDVASGVAQKAQEVASSVSQKAQDVASTATERTDEAISTVGEKMSSLADTIREKAPQEGTLGTAATAVADKLEAGGQYLQEHGLGDMADDVGALVRQHPLPSLLLVFGVGFLLGSALRR